MKVTAVIPAYNEEKTIGSIVLKTRQYALRVIVVDDGSQDATGEIAKLAGAQVIVHHQNRGKGAALKTGFQAIINTDIGNTDIIVTLDSDGQHDPQEIPIILEPIIEDKADLVNGSRYMTKKNDTDDENGDKTPRYRRFGQTILDSATNISTGELDVTDSQSGFRAFRATTLPTYNFHSSDYTIESEMLIEAAKAGLRIVEVPINITYGEMHNYTQNPISHGLHVLVSLIQDMEFNRPLYYFTLPGIILMAIGMILGLTFFSQYLAGVMTTLLPTTLAALVTVFGAFIAFTGLILHSVSRMITRTMGK
ncbi:MAG: glycosyltransferase family 2 protein [Methanobacteriaceae archaeon]